MSFTLTLWTNDSAVARKADLAGVDRIGLDLETLGKVARQSGLPTWISQHDISQLPAIREALRRASLFVRCNPLNPTSRDEVARLIDLGAEVIMLPNFEDIADVERFLRIVNGRARVVPLVERLKAARAIHRFASISEIHEIHIGLNDLSIDLGLKQRMAVLVTDLLVDAARAAGEIGISLSVGGVARALDQNLPIPSDLVYAQYPRLNAAGAFIAQSFHPETLNEAEFASEIARVRYRMAFWRRVRQDELENARLALARIVAEDVEVSA
jgi:HpcH/HpaI aldolase/citrate lyase family